MTMSRHSSFVTYAAGIWIVAESVNIAWPRPLNGNLYLNWGLLIMSGVLALLGAMICAHYVEPVVPASTTPAGNDK